MWKSLENVIYRALDKALFATKKYPYFSYFLMKTYVVGTHVFVEK